MPKHRTLNLRRLVSALSWDLFQEYFAQLRVDHRPSAWAYLNPDAMFDFLESPQNDQARSVILEDFRRINDICAARMDLVVRAYRTYHIPFNDHEPDLGLAMRLFLYHREAFNYAWSRYLFHSTASKVTLFRLGVPPLEIASDCLEKFGQELREWFRQLGKGEQCLVECTDEGDEVVFLISHGSYLRTVAHWQQERVEIMSYRAAAEDVVVYHRQRATLTVRAPIEKDQGEYLRAFGEFIAGDVGLKERAVSAQTFTLVPLQRGVFNYTGNNAVLGVKLVKARLKMPGQDSEVVEVKSADVVRTLRRRLKGLSLSDGELTLARFHFRLMPEDEKPLTVVFDIEPPSRTDLAQKQYADLVEGYLREQGVMLV